VLTRVSIPRNRLRPPGSFAEPERIVLRPRGGAVCNKPPVRIFVGSEPRQHRAERVLVWSVEQVRDPSRTYEIHLMKDLVGFDRRRWLTGFTNYRFAIPRLAGETGRAIYNDVDQIYLVDPAELFDLDMDGHGFLAISDRDSSVMLIDCARMARIWRIEDAYCRRRKAMEGKARAVPRAWGRLAPVWNSRDTEYVAGRSKLLHYTTIHTQPWQPFPEHFVYQFNSVGQVWMDLERSADAAGFQLFTFNRPSRSYLATVERLRRGEDVAVRRGGAEGLAELLAAAQVDSVLEYSLGGRSGAADAAYGLRRVTRHDPLAGGNGEPPQGRFDAVVCRGGLELLSDDDVAWVVEELFAHARCVVYAEVADTGAARPAHARGARDPAWWYALFGSAGARHPEVHWRTVLRGDETCCRDGGWRMAGLPRVWVLLDQKAGHTVQSVGLAERLGWPFTVKRLRFNPLNLLSNRMLGASRLGLDPLRSDALSPPWPDLVIATGKRTASVARWIGARSRGQTRLLQNGRKGGDIAEAFDLVVSCRHFRLPAHPKRIETLAPLTSITGARLAEAEERWSSLFAGAARPRVVLVVGGNSWRHRLDLRTARRMAERVCTFADSARGSLFAITSPRTGVEATEAIERVLATRHHLHRWKKGERDNPYVGFLASADVLVVTGESESMLAEAAATGKPVYIYPIPERRRGPRLWFSGWVTARAYSRPRKRKGTVRPQQGLERFCARLIDLGLVRPPRDLNELHRGLVEAGVARFFGEPLETDGQPGLDEMELVARRVRALMGYPEMRWQPGETAGGEGSTARAAMR
jgi:mitochondrial fission protein ELM1